MLDHTYNFPELRSKQKHDSSGFKNLRFERNKDNRLFLIYCKTWHNSYSSLNSNDGPRPTHESISMLPV